MQVRINSSFVNNPYVTNLVATQRRVTAVERIVGYDFRGQDASRRSSPTLLLSAQFVSTPGAPRRQRSQPRTGSSTKTEITNRRKDTVSNPYLARIGARLRLYRYLLRLQYTRS
ncbi:hypothetical protein GBA52_014190 [Prunus armeniaca]|nr:hypothetical protein GBA52_014190 [Prunus armeniaca]